MQRPSVSGPVGPGQPTFRKKSILTDKDGNQGPPTIIGLIAGKRFAKKMSQRYRKTPSMSTSGTARSWNSTNIRLEPTYQLEPKTRFQPGKVNEIVRAVVNSRMMGFKYSSRMAAMMSKVLTEEIKDKVKGLAFERYKIICLVSIGENKGQGVAVSSRCVWDESSDRFTNYTYETKDAYCNVIVYGVYHE
ncbi:dynein light chain Tctex-type protein 2B-like [Tubulanus polymorphus]|uniref:dynein light chain Tctex-type protein 2B-like n=1 Tax=Tubulanus polymorphus TaxID=672921 RepID=UPI003DA500D7